MGSPVVVASPRKSPSYNRRANKPLVEKKRRARINGCLGQLKSLILGAMQTEGAQVSRLEKADILEMTVKYLRHVQSQQVAPEPEVVTKFSAGYTECASEVIRYIDAVNCVSPDVRAKLENHLVERLRGSLVQAPSQTPTPTLPTQQQQQHMNPPTQYAHVTFQPSQATSPAVNEIIYSHTAKNVCDKVLSYQNDIDIANKAAAEALKRPTPVMSSPSRASVMGIRQTIQASPVSPKRPSSSSPKSDPQERNGQLFGQLTSTRQEPHVHQVLHPVPRLARSQSTSPLHVRHADDSVCMPSAAFTGERERHCSGGEQAMHVVSSHYTPAPSYTHAAYSPPAYGHEAYISNTADKQLNMSSAKSESENYFSDYERPLHIHIPDSPRIPPTPSPPFYHPGMSYHPTQPHESNALVSPRNTSCSSLDESPPTILYGYSQPRTASPVYKMETEEMTQYSSNRYSSRYSDYEQENVQAMISYENAIDSRDHHQDGFQGAKRAVTNTPSPPTLTREEPFIDHSNRPHLQTNHSQNDLYNERAQNAANLMQTQLCYVRESSHYTPPPQFGDQVYPAYRNHYSGHRDNQYCDQISHESNQRYSSDDVPSHQQHNSGHQSRPDVCNKREPAPQPESRTPPHNEQPTVNGPAQPQPTVQSRQKDTSLSLLTLKRRILYGLGSEGEWTASGKTAGQQKCTQDNRADESETRALPCKERDLITPAAQCAADDTVAILCRSSTQCAADDTVWRPW